MTDLRSWSKDLIIELIKLYKSFPCLWKIKSNDYKNKNLREEAYKKLIDFCKDKGFTEANRDFVSKKIQSLRGSFRKELKKQGDSQRSGAGTDDVYTPTLWYFNYLLFTKDQELPTSRFENTEDDSNTYDPEVSTMNENTDTIHQEEQHNESVEETASSANAMSVSVTNKKRKLSSNYQAEFFKVCTDTLKSTKEVSESEVVGMNMAKKIAEMDPLQAIYAESIINNVLRKGLLKQLKENTDLCDTCQQHNLTHDLINIDDRQTEASQSVIYAELETENDSE